MLFHEVKSFYRDDANSMSFDINPFFNMSLHEHTMISMKANTENVLLIPWSVLYGYVIATLCLGMEMVVSVVIRCKQGVNEARKDKRRRVRFVVYNVQGRRQVIAYG